MRMLNVHLTADLEAFVDDQVASGQFTSSDDVVLAGLRLMQQQDNAARLTDLRQAWRQGIDSGDSSRSIARRARPARGDATRRKTRRCRPSSIRPRPAAISRISGSDSATASARRQPTPSMTALSSASSSSRAIP